jgi:hypothetical protein
MPRAEKPSVVFNTRRLVNRDKLNQVHLLKINLYSQF